MATLRELTSAIARWRRAVVWRWSAPDWTAWLAWLRTVRRSMNVWGVLARAKTGSEGLETALAESGSKVDVVAILQEVYKCGMRRDTTEKRWRWVLVGERRAGEEGFSIFRRPGMKGGLSVVDLHKGRTGERRTERSKARRGQLVLSQEGEWAWDGRRAPLETECDRQADGSRASSGLMGGQEVARSRRWTGEPLVVRREERGAAGWLSTRDGPAVGGS